MVLDTSIIIAILRIEQSVLARLPTVSAAVSPIAVGELYFGAERSQHPAVEIGKVYAFIQDTQVLSCDWSTGRHYASIKNGLTGRGTLIPENDMWIAATAMQYNIPLVCRDSHFSWIAGLTVEFW